VEGEKQALWVGVVVGVIGYAAVAMLYAAVDLVAGRGLLYTVDLLGKAVFLGLRDPAVLSLPIRPDPVAVVLYNGLHLLASIAIGLIVVGLVERVRRERRLAGLALFTIVAGFVVTIVAVGYLTRDMRPVLPWWSIVVSNSLAVIVAGSYLQWRWPDTWELLSPFGD
jgi:hypothetical protein